MTYAETAVVPTIERLTGRAVSAVPETELARLDQFHVGGAAAIERLIPGLRLGPHAVLLDVGAGFGGPARQFARSTGCRVVGVDITAAYVEAARVITERTGPAGQVSFEHTDVRRLRSHGFDAACTVHVQMNVADKASFYREIARRLLPEGRLAVWEICRVGDAEPAPPLPWTIDGTDAHLSPADDLHAAIAQAGFEPIEWVDETGWALDWFAGLGRDTGGPRTPTLGDLLDDGATRMLNLVGALASGVVSVYHGLWTRTDEPSAAPA